MKNICKYILFAIIGLFCTLGLPKVSAVTPWALNSNTTGCTSNAYNYSLSTSGANYDIYNVGTINTVYSGKLGGFQVYLDGGYTAGTKYTITISNNTYDFNTNWNINQTVGVQGFNTTSVGASASSLCYNQADLVDYTINSITLNTTAGGQYKNVVITFTATTTRENITFYIYTDGVALSGISNFRVNSITVANVGTGTITGDSTNSDVINNQNQNTQSIIQSQENNKNDIINNNNENTDKIVDELQDFADKIESSQNQTNDLITDETPPSLEGLENAVGWLPPGPVDSILNLPLSVFQSLSSSLGKTCEPVILPIPYINKSLELPCVSSLYAKMGVSDYIETIGIIASAFILLGYLLNLYKWVDDQLSLRENTWNDMDQWGGV